MPVIGKTPETISIQLKHVARSIFPGITISETNDNVFTYAFEGGSPLFTAEISIGLKPIDTAIILRPVGTKVEFLVKVAETFCKEKFDCTFEV